MRQLVANCSICKDFKRVQSKQLGNDAKADLVKLEQLDSVAIDSGYLGLQQPFLAFVDEFSGFKQAWFLLDAKTRSVISTLEDFFSTVGNPLIIRSDGGPCFRSQALQERCRKRELDT